MEIRRLTAEEAPGWAWDAANSIVETRMASGGLLRAGATSLTRSVTSTFRRNVPYNMDVWVDDNGSWLWVERAKNSRVIVRAGLLTPHSSVSQWADFVTREFSRVKVSWCVWGERDSLVDLVETIGAMPTAIGLRASIAGMDTLAGASDAWLRPMGAAEFTNFQRIAIGERGEMLVALGECATVDEGCREASDVLEDRLADGVDSPGHYLYSLFHEGRAVGGVWMENDGGTAVVRSIVLEENERQKGHRRAAISALATAAHGQGARQLQLTVLFSDSNFLEGLLNAGMDIISVNYLQEPAPARIPAFQNI